MLKSVTNVFVPINALMVQWSMMLLCCGSLQVRPDVIQFLYGPDQAYTQACDFYMEHPPGRFQNFLKFYMEMPQGSIFFSQFLYGIEDREVGPHHVGVLKSDCISLLILVLIYKNIIEHFTKTPFID